MKRYVQMTAGAGAIVGLLLAATTGGADAQSATTPAGSNLMKGDRPLPQAPVGHRQPRADQVPQTQNNANDPISREDALLDRKIKSICRGC